MELLDREAFRSTVREGRMIVITDSATGTKLHRPECTWVDERHFVQKVLDNDRRNGCYYAVDSAEEARSSFGGLLRLLLSLLAPAGRAVRGPRSFLGDLQWPKPGVSDERI